MSINIAKEYLIKTHGIISRFHVMEVRIYQPTCSKLLQLFCYYLSHIKVGMNSVRINCIRIFAWFSSFPFHIKQNEHKCHSTFFTNVIDLPCLCEKTVSSSYWIETFSWAWLWFIWTHMLILSTHPETEAGEKFRVFKNMTNIKTKRVSSSSQ